MGYADANASEARVVSGRDRQQAGYINFRLFAAPTRHCPLVQSLAENYRKGGRPQ